MSLLLLTFTVASAAPRECWTVKPVTGRVRDNVGHQGEELVYRLVAAGLRQAPPRAVYWPWPICRGAARSSRRRCRTSRWRAATARRRRRRVSKVKKIWRPEHKRPQWPLYRDPRRGAQTRLPHCNLYNTSRRTLVVRILQRRDSSSSRRRRQETDRGLRRRRHQAQPARRRRAQGDDLRGGAGGGHQSRLRGGSRRERESRWILRSTETVRVGGRLGQRPRRASGECALDRARGAAWLLEALPCSGNWGKGTPSTRCVPSQVRNTDLEYLRVCGVRPSSSLPKNEQLCERRTPAARARAGRARLLRDAAPAPKRRCASSGRASASMCWRSLVDWVFRAAAAVGGRPGGVVLRCGGGEACVCSENSRPAPLVRDDREARFGGGDVMGGSAAPSSSDACHRVLLVVVRRRGGLPPC